MSKTIEVTKVIPSCDSIEYEIHDNTNLHLLKDEIVHARLQYYNAETFGFNATNLPESILSLPITLYLLPITWFYGVELVVPSIDKTLYEDLDNIHTAYSKIYGPFKPEWRGKVTAKSIVENKMPEKRYDNIVFFSGGVDAVHAGISNSGKRNVLVTVPSIEATFSGKDKNYGNDFLKVKSRLIREFSQVSGNEWLMAVNTFPSDVFDDRKIQVDLRNKFGIDSPAFRFDGWFGMKYLGNILSSGPFAYAMGISQLIMGSGFELLEGRSYFNLDGANPELSDSIKFARISFAEQDGLYTRRSQKVKDVMSWCIERNKKVNFWACFNDSAEQCGKCTKCVRTQLNLLCQGQNPKNWGFAKFDEEKFSHLVRGYKYHESNVCWIWDIVDSIDENTTYPYCNDLLHWLKSIGYKKYAKRAYSRLRLRRLSLKLLKIHRYPHYLKVVAGRLIDKKKNV